MASKNKKACKYGESCYRTNEDHLKNFIHKTDEDIENKMAGETKNQPRGTKRTRQAAISENVKVTAKEEPTTKKSEPEISESATETKTTEIKKKEESEEKVQSTVDCFDLSQVKDLKEFVFEHYSMHMPDDFYELLDFCKSLNAKDAKSKPL